MTTTSIVEIIQHYQRSIDNSQDNEARLLHCINKLYKLPIKVEHLQETGVGKTVNSLRKFNGEIGVAAKTLVTKWKAMVAAEEEPMDTTSQKNESETPDNNNDDNNNDGGAIQENEDDENHNRQNSSPIEQNKHGEDKDKHKKRSSSSIGHNERRHSSSSHHRSEKSSKHSNDKHKSSSSSSKDKDSSHKISNNSSKEGEKKKTEHKSSRDKHKDQDHNGHRARDSSEKRKEEKQKTADKDIKLESSSSSSQHKTSSSSSSKSKHDDKHGSSSKEKDRERSDKHQNSSRDKERTKKEKSSSSSSKDKSDKSSSTLSSKSSTKDSSESLERKRRHNSDNESIDFKSPQPKVAKVSHKSSLSSSSSSRHESKPETSPPEEGGEEVDDSFDSSMGANFNDILGMLDVPVKKSKKSLKSPSLTPNGNSSSSKQETTPSRPSTSSNNTSNKVNGVRTPFTAPSSYSIPSTSKAITLKPDLLAPTAKLEPLDPSIVLELPTISTNYKPMPLNQTVMDCVFNTSSSSNSRPARTLTDAEAITHGISSKTIRTKIYSGVRTGQTYQVPSLFDMCTRVLQKNIDAMEYTGGVPFEVLKPVLDRCSPQQLYNFEEYNPYIMEDSDGLWQIHVQRNYRTKKREENESWREMFMRCQAEEEQKLSILKNHIRASQKIATAPIRKTQLAFIDSMVKPPRNVQRKQEQYGTKSKMVATPASRVASLQSVTPNAAKIGDKRLKVVAPVRAQVHANPIVRNKKAPLMAKTLQFIKGRLKR